MNTEADPVTDFSQVDQINAGRVAFELSQRHGKNAHQHAAKLAAESLAKGIRFGNTWKLRLGLGAWARYERICHHLVLCVCRTDTAASRAYRKYGFNFFLKPWYSIFLRCMGIIVLLLLAVSDYAEVALRYGYL
ncbi:MAG: hypothetical protein ACLPTF_00510 [Steroidobacteraceae bacterium]